MAVTVSAVLDHIAVSPDGGSVNEGSTLQLTATPEDKNNNPLTLSPGDSLLWSSSNTSLATVTSSGLVTGVAPGAVQITVADSNNPTINASVNVTVAAVLDQIAVSPDGGSVNEDSTLQLTATPQDNNNNPVTLPIGDSLNWTSADTAVATVDATGLVTSIAPGTVQITVEDANDSSISTSVAITVVGALDHIAILPSAGSVNAGDMLQLTATPEDKNDNPVTLPIGDSLNWTSADTDVATVDATGLVTGVAPGTVQITVVDANDPSIIMSDTVTVSAGLLDHIAVAPDNASLNEGQTLELTATPQDASNNTVALAPGDSLVWSSSDTSLATVSNTGLVTGVATGTVQITVMDTDEPSISQSVTLTIVDNASPTPILPEDGSEDQEQQPTFSWSAVDAPAATELLWIRTRPTCPWIQAGTPVRLRYSRTKRQIRATPLQPH